MYISQYLFLFLTGNLLSLGYKCNNSVLLLVVCVFHVSECISGNFLLIASLTPIQVVFFELILQNEMSTLNTVFVRNPLIRYVCVYVLISPSFFVCSYPIPTFLHIT